MKTKLICAAAFVAAVMSAPAIRADVFSDADEKQQARVEREQDLYDEGNDAIDEHDWKRAARDFQRVAEMRMSHADAALYWLAYSQGKMGMRPEALSTIVQLKSTYPKSKWSDDANKLELEIRQSAGQHIQLEHVDDLELKLMALNGLMNSDPERAIPILDNLLKTSKEPKLRDKALFILSQSSSQPAYDILSRVAKNNVGVRLAVTQKCEAGRVAGDADDLGVDLVVVEAVVGSHHARRRTCAETNHGRPNRSA